MAFEEINPVVKYLYYSDAVFHSMLSLKAEELGKIPYDMMLLLNNKEDISELASLSEMKRRYETLLLEHLYSDPFRDWESDEVFKVADGLYDRWNHKLEEFINDSLHRTKTEGDEIE